MPALEDLQCHTEGMSKPDPPRYTAAQLAAAADRIRHRHRDAEHHLDDGDGAEGMLSYLRKCGADNLRSGPAGTHDLTDAAMLAVGLWWRQQDHERWIIRAGERRGFNRRVLGAMWGIKVGQALIDRLRRLTRRLDVTAPEQQPAAAEPAPTADGDAVLRELAQHLVRDQRWYDDEGDTVVDPDLLADYLARRLPLRATITTLIRELDADCPGWRLDLDDAAEAALAAAERHLTGRPKMPEHVANLSG